MKKTMKIAALLLSAVIMTCLMTGCYESTEETQYTDELKKQISDMYGFPDVSNFFEYSQLKEIYEIYQGTCIGYGIPYSASITAPESPQEAYAQGSHTNILPLAEPNGLYTDGLSTSATWILTTDAKGNITPTYVESEITISQSKMDVRLCEDWSIPSDY